MIETFFAGFWTICVLIVVYLLVVCPIVYLHYGVELSMGPMGYISVTDDKPLPYSRKYGSAVAWFYKFLFLMIGLTASITAVIYSVGLVVEGIISL